MAGELLTVTAPVDRGAVTWRIHDPGGHVGRRLVTGRPYEHRLLNRIRRSRPAGTAVDIGAHVGNHALYLALVCGLAVHAFEPGPGRVAALRTNLAMNPSAADGVTVWPYAAGAEVGGARWRGNMTLTPDEGGEVPVRPVDQLLCLDDLSVVKVDVEGMEPAALAGMAGHLSRCRPQVWVETHSHRAHRAHGEVLEPLGYEFVDTVAMGSRMGLWQCRG